VVVSKFAGILTLYRKVQDSGRPGIHLDRATLAGGEECRMVRSRAYEMQAADDPGLADGCSETSRRLPVARTLEKSPGPASWEMRMDDRPWGGPSPPAVA